MGARRTAWHLLFGVHLREAGSPSPEIRSEVSLAEEPPRIDYLILRKGSDSSCFEPGVTLRRLWPRLPRVAVMELKTVGRPYRTGDLDRLGAYQLFYRANQRDPLLGQGDITGVLVVPARTPSLLADVDRVGFRWQDLGGGYWHLDGGVLSLDVVEIDVVCEAEQDDRLRVFSHQGPKTPEGVAYWHQLVGNREVAMGLQKTEDYMEVIQELISKLSPEQRMAGLAPEQILRTLSPEQILKAIPPEHVLLSLPDVVLRCLPAEYVATLPEATQAAIRARCVGNVGLRRA